MVLKKKQKGGNYENLAFTLTNIFSYLSVITPFMLAFFLVLSSIFNQDIKGFIYLAGVLIATIINILLINIIQESSIEGKNPICSLFSFNILNLGGDFNNPSLSISFIAFTVMYLLLPMIFNNQMNWVVVVFLMIVLIVDIFTNLTNNCTAFGGVFVGLITGIILGAGWYSIIKFLGNNELLYFNEFVSNNVVCSRPSKQSFKCSVYKNGELIKNNIV